MRIVALEEHFAIPALVGRIDPALVAQRGFPPPGGPTGPSRKRNELPDFGPVRIADMDRSGITVQVLSVSGPGADLLAGDAGIALARDYNDALAREVTANPDRYRGFAHLPMMTPWAAADELERAVTRLGFHGALINGLTDGRFLDDPAFAPVLARADALDVPLYLHPGIPPEPVRAAYYDGLPGYRGFLLATAGWGWHIETAVHVLRLAVSGTLDRHPQLKLIIGHMGEALPFMLARADEMFAAEPRDSEPGDSSGRSFAEAILDQVWITTSGFFTLPPLMIALQTFGADRVLFSVDYPYASNARARAFLDQLPVSPTDREKIAHGNADRLLRLPV